MPVILHRLPRSVDLFTIVGIFLILLMLLSPAQAQETGNVFTGHVVAVTAGDTLRVRVGGGWSVTVRLHGIECPRTPPSLQEAATRYTTQHVRDAEVRVEVRGTASRSTVFGEVYPKAERESLNLELIRAGLATWARQYAPARTDIRDAEQSARNAKRGVWRRSESTPSASPSPSPPAQRYPIASDTNAHRVIRDFFLGGILGSAVTLTALLGYTLGTRRKLSLRRLAAQILLSLLGGVVGAFLAELPGAIAATASHPEQLLPSLAAFLLPPIALWIWWQGMQTLSITTRLRCLPSDPRSAPPGFVKLQGAAYTVTGELAVSAVGTIPGLFVREVTTRYTAETVSGKRFGSPRWITLRDSRTAVDFSLISTEGDGIGTAHILAAQEDAMPHAVAPAEWIPYHVARFYNAVPVEDWYKTAYEGDTRTEVYFVPDGAMLTVWGDLYSPAIAEQRSGDRPIARIAPSLTTGKMTIVDGPEQRAYTGPRRSLTGRILVLLAGTVGIVGTTAAVILGGAPALQSATAAWGALLALILILAISHGATLAWNAAIESARNETDPLRLPATAAWESYRHHFPGQVISAAIDG